MSSLDSLPGDHRAVLQLVLQRGRSYDDIAQLLSIDRAAVRERALTAIDLLGPDTGIPPERQALITDYLLGQLPDPLAQETRDRLGASPAERAWARVVASELTPLAGDRLPEIPVVGHGIDPSPTDPTVTPTDPTITPAEAAPAAEAAGPASPDDERTPPGEPTPAAEPTAASPDVRRRSSRTGGAILIGLAVAVIAVVVVLITNGGGKQTTTTTTSAGATTPAATQAATSSTMPATTSAPATTSTPATTSATATTSTTATATTPTRVLGQINLASPRPGSKTAGIAEVLRQGTVDGLAIVAQNIAPNTQHNAYAVWLYNSPSDSYLMGFVNPGVGSSGRMSTAGAFPANARHYGQLIVTLETTGNPKQPGKIVLQGKLSIS